MKVVLVFLSVAILVTRVPATEAALTEPSRFVIPLPDSNPELRLAQVGDPSQYNPAAQETPSVGGNVARSLILPGWGQFRGGYKGLGMVFLGVEAAIWTTFFISIAQGEKRENTYEETALLFADIDLNTVDDEVRRLVGQFQSSEEYNRLVVSREAAALHFGDFDAYNRYIDENSLQGLNSWQWATEDRFFQYSSERRSSDHAFQRAEYALFAAVINRAASALFAWRLKPHPSGDPQAAQPGIQTPAGRVEWSLTPTPRDPARGHLAWVVRF